MANHSNFVNKFDPYNEEPVVECYIMQIIAVYYTVVFFLSLIANSILLWILIFFKEFRNPMNAFILALTVCNFLGSIIQMPMVIVSSFYCKWVYGKSGCIFAGFVMYTIGCTSIFLLTAVSFERFYTISNPLRFKAINYRSSILIIFLCLLFGVFWALLPIFGWSHYSLEGTLTSCSVEWDERSLNVVSYNIAMFTFVYILPLCAIAFSNFKLIMIIRKLPKFFPSTVILDKKRKKRIQFEKNLTISAIILIVGFVISWTPYAIVSMYKAFFYNGKMNPLTATIPSMFAKASLFWSSGIYLYTNKQIKEFIKQYNKIAEICFNDCVNDFTSRKVLNTEDTCVSNCLEKYLKMNQRVSMRFQEHQMLINENQVVAAQKMGLFK